MKEGEEVGKGEMRRERKRVGKEEGNGRKERY